MGEEWDNICKDIQKGNNNAFGEFIKNPTIRRAIGNISLAVCRKTGCKLPIARGEVILCLWNIIRKDYPQKTLEEGEVLAFLFSRRLLGKSIDNIFRHEMGMVKRLKGGKITYTKLETGEEPLYNLPAKKDKPYNVHDVIEEAIEKSGLTDFEKLAFILHWDLDLDPTARERGTWSIEQISILLSKPEKEIRDMLKMALEKVGNYVKTTEFGELYRAGEYH